MSTMLQRDGEVIIFHDPLREKLKSGSQSGKNTPHHPIPVVLKNHYYAELPVIKPVFD